jgi:endonuclease YncB( thermonuclease family)
MNPVRAVLAGFLVFLFACSPALAERCRATDGDSLRCGGERVRLADVYAAELNQKGGRAAKRNLAALVDGRDVRLVRHGRDRYGRTLADVYVDGRRVVQSDIGPRSGNGARSGYATRP